MAASNPVMLPVPKEPQVTRAQFNYICGLMNNLYWSKYEVFAEMKKQFGKEYTRLDEMRKSEATWMIQTLKAKWDLCKRSWSRRSAYEPFEDLGGGGDNHLWY